MYVLERDRNERDRDRDKEKEREREIEMISRRRDTQYEGKRDT